MTMRVTVDQLYEPAVRAFSASHRWLPHAVTAEDGRLVLELDESRLSEQAARQIRLHFKYLPLFTWAGSDLDDVIFWEQPQLFSELAADFATLTAELPFERIAALEARGFLLAGILGQALGLPIYAVRKDKPFYRRFPGRRVPFTNWKGKDEVLFLPQKPYLDGARMLVVDDLIETGNSLAATVRGLEELGVTVTGAFYLCNVLAEGRRAEFNFPIRSFVIPGVEIASGH